MVLTLTEKLNTIAEEFPNNICIKYKRDRVLSHYTYDQMHEASLKVATWITYLGLPKGEKVVLILENQPAWPIIYFGILYAGMTCVPLDTQLSPHEVNVLIKDSSAKIIFCSYDILNNKIPHHIQRGAQKIVVLGDSTEHHEKVVHYSQIAGIQFDKQRLPNIYPDDYASLIYTSGTTSMPKGVVLSHRNLCANFNSINKLGMVNPTDNFIVLLPLHHTYPCMISLIIPLLMGATITFPPPGFKPSELSVVMNETGVTMLVGVPQLFSLIHTAIFQKLKAIPYFLKPFVIPFIRNKIKHRFGRNLRFMLSGGARLDPIIARNLTRIGFRVIEGYGLTETSPVVTFNSPHKIKFGSVGTPLPDVEIRIRKPNIEGIGTVFIKGPNVMIGYFNRPELTASVIEEGWFNSGDLGYIDKDGYLFLTGREKEVIVLQSGKNIYPGELEEHYQKSPFIKELCIIEKREERDGKEVLTLHAVIVPNFEYFQEIQEGNIQGKIRWELENLSQNLPAYQHIMGFTLTKDGLPRTTLRKLKRYQVKETYFKHVSTSVRDIEKPLSEADSIILKRGSTQKMINYFATKCKKSVNIDSHLEIDLGIDSLSRVEVGLDLERIFSLTISDEELFRAGTIRDLLTIIEEGKQGEGEIKSLEKIDKEIMWDHILREPPKEEIRNNIRLKPPLFD